MLYLCEFLDMRWIRSFVPEILSEFEYFLESSYSRFFQRGLKRDPEIHICIEVMMMRDEWSCCCSGSRISKHVRLYLHESFFGVKFPENLIHF